MYYGKFAVTIIYIYINQLLCVYSNYSRMFCVYYCVKGDEWCNINCFFIRTTWKFDLVYAR